MVSKFAFHCCGKDYNNKKLGEERGNGLLLDLHYQAYHWGESGQEPGGGTEGEIMEGCCLLPPQVHGQLSFLTPPRAHLNWALLRLDNNGMFTQTIALLKCFLPSNTLLGALLTESLQMCSHRHFCSDNPLLDLWHIPWCWIILMCVSPVSIVLFLVELKFLKFPCLLSRNMYWIYCI